MDVSKLRITIKIRNLGLQVHLSYHIHVSLQSEEDIRNSEDDLPRWFRHRWGDVDMDAIYIKQEDGVEKEVEEKAEEPKETGRTKKERHYCRAQILPRQR